MKSRSFWLLSLVLWSVSPVFARVVSYAPYTNRPAVPAYQARVARWFVLLEGTHEDALQSGVQAVLYDATGAEEPRVIYSTDGRQSPALDFAAVYEPPSGSPVILLVGPSLRAISPDGGKTWRPVDLVSWVTGPRSPDRGGPHTYGLATNVRLGTPAYPFVVATSDVGVMAISLSGKTKKLVDARNIVGRDHAGARFLYVANSELRMVDLQGQTTKVGALNGAGVYYAWIASDGTVYAMLSTSSGRAFVRYRNGFPEGILAPPGSVGFFAIPTHDYDGAWILTRQLVGGTTLLRHTAERNLEVMWHDPARPDVEALHAGPSGETLLVQVHRERDVALEEPFKDPALAVWRVGEGAPAEYDELFLNEAPTKQFVIVNADKVADGETFVFDSGFTENGVPDAPVSAPIGGGGDVPQEWGVVRGSLRQHLVLPGVSRTRGAFGSFWQTDVAIYNPLPEPQNVEIRFSPLGEAPPAAVAADAEPKTITLSLAAREIRPIEDVLGALFSIEDGGGALHFLPEEGVNVTSRTYTRSGGGTVGYGMPAVDFFNAAGPRFPVSFAGAFPGAHFRTNLLLTDTSGRGVHAELTGGDYLGTQDRHEVSAPTNGIGQFNAIDGAIGSPGGLLVEPTRGTAIPTVVAIDNRSNDATWFPPDLPGDIPRVIPIVGHVNGSHGARFRTDLYFYNPSLEHRDVVIEAFLWQGGRSPLRQTIFLRPKETRRIEDVMQNLFFTTGLARLQYTTRDPGQGVRVTSRAYHVDANGGTYGCLVPPLNNFQIATRGETLEILGAGGGPGFRTNLGLVDVSRNPWGTPPRVRVSVRTGAFTRTFTATIPPTGGTQINDLFSREGLPTPKAGLIRIEVLEGMVGAFATLVDNTTNDSTYLGAYLAAK